MSKKLYPQISIASFVQRANDIVVACRNDRAELEKAGLQWEQVERASVLLKECSDTEAQLRVIKQDNMLLTADLRTYKSQCRIMRNHLARQIRNAAKTLNIDFHLPQYKSHLSQADLVQDLNDLGVLCRNNRSLLEKTGFDLKIAEQATHKSKELAERIAEIEVNKTNTVSEQLLHRNVLCKELYDLLKGICLIGRTTFMDNPLRKRFYQKIKE